MIRVLQSFVDPRTHDANPFMSLLLASLRGRVLVSTFNWKRALLGRYDVLHIHWPEYLFQARDPLRTMVKVCLTTLLLVRIKVRRTAVVRTMHNADAHEGLSWLERGLARLLDEATTGYIVMNPDTVLPTPAPSVYIPHGHYRDCYEPALGVTPSSTTGARLLYFGLIRPYKGVEALLHAFRESSEQDGWRLRLIGRPLTSDTEKRIKDLASRDHRVSCYLQFAPDRKLVAEIAESTLIVLPYAGLNSGAILLALSLGRPVLTADGSNSRNFVREFGDRWIRTYEGDLSPQDLTQAVEWSAGVFGSNALPDMKHREWDMIGDSHRGWYQRMSEVRRHSGSVS